MEDKLRALLTEFGLGRPRSLRRSQHSESSDHKENLLKIGEYKMDSPYPCMRMDFPRWEDGESMGWISRAKRYFRYYRTPNTSMVDITSINLEGDTIQWYIWFEHTQGVPMWRQFKSELLVCFRSSEYENIDGQLAKIR
ncbi:hypothetical protein BHE74_00055246 [Ensete ventricosum]|nr:hypothetical protein BHE74_00055246 [Ensete ventricosum]